MLSTQIELILNDLVFESTRGTVSSKSLVMFTGVALDSLRYLDQ